MESFAEKLQNEGLTLKRAALQTLQINVGRKCNQACRHCHVDAAPWRTEMIDKETAQRLAAWIAREKPAIVDITGGAPELSEFFRFLVESSREAGAHVIDRCNLTIVEEEGFGWLPEYLAKHRVEVVASLPCYSEENVNKQRGNGVFQKSISALKKLNAVGYGKDLSLNLVYNPVGPTLPGPQAELESDYKEALSRDFGIVFNRLYTITNQPIARFAEDLRQLGKWDDYMMLLVKNFNRETVDGLMCRTTLSVDYQGRLYDCDFNQMLDLTMGSGEPRFLWEIKSSDLENAGIRTGAHCFACTAGCGSSCTGSLKSSEARALL